MNIFQKIAIFLFRLLGIGVFIFGIFGFIDVIKTSIAAPMTARLVGAAGLATVSAALNAVVITSFLYLILGAVIFFVGLPLGKIIGRNLGN